MYDGSLDNFVNGGTIKASGDIPNGDYLLLELTPDTDTIPSEYDIAYAGWNALTTATSYTHSIHHPLGDVKKITFDSTSPSTGGGFYDHHWLTTHTPALSGSGVLEGGSSGGPLFDENFRVIGQHTNTSTLNVDICTDTTEVLTGRFGKFEFAYDDDTTDSTTYLKYWLDPNNVGISTLDYLYPNASCCVGSIRGNIDGDSSDIIDISDAVYMVQFMFYQGPVPPCEEEGDVDASGELDVGDLVYLVDYMFGNPTGPAPVACP